MHRILGWFVLGTVLSLSVSGCATGRWPTTGSRAIDSMAIGAGVGAVGGAVLTGGSAVGTVGGAAVGGVIGHEVGK